jgi:hypothetical protein
MPESGGNDNFWNALFTAGASMYAQNKKKKEENKNLDWMNSVLQEKRQYEEDKINRYKSSPGAQMSPLIMEMLVGAYAPKMKKFGIDFPLEKMLAAINGGGGESGGAAGGGARPENRTLSQIANGERPTGEGVKWGFQARSDGTFGPSNTTMKDGTGYTMGKLDPENEGYNGKDWGNKLGSADGDIFGREQTRDGTGGAEWTKDSNGRKVYAGRLATGGQTAFYPGTTKVTQWQDPTISKQNFEGDNYVPNGTAPTPEQVLNGENLGDMSKLKQWWVKNGPKIAAGVGTVFTGGLGGTVVGKGLTWGQKYGILDGDPETPWFHKKPAAKQNGAN